MASGDGEDDDAETVKRIEDTVRDVLEEMDMAGMVRAAAAQRLGIDLSVPRRREIVQRVIDSFLQSLDSHEQDDEAVVEEKQDQAQEEGESQDDKEEDEEEDEEEEEEEECEYDDAETMERIEETVWEILKEAGTDPVTLAAVLAAASRRLGFDLSLPHRKEFVQSVIKSFLIWMDYNDEEEVPVPVQVREEEKEYEKQEGEDQVQLIEVKREEEGEKRGLGKRGSDDDPISHGLSCKRRSILQELKRKTLVSICEFYEKDGEQQLPTSEEMSLTVEQRKAFQKVLPQIEDAIKQLGDSID